MFGSSWVSRSIEPDLSSVTPDSDPDSAVPGKGIETTVDPSETAVLTAEVTMIDPLK